MITKLAVKWLTYKLRNDLEFWRVYQANIAMKIHDNYNKYYPRHTKERFGPHSSASEVSLHKFCNICVLVGPF